MQPAMDVVRKDKPSTKERRVVVTGLGVASPLGHEPSEFYENLLEGVSGISEIEAFDCAQYSTVGSVLQNCYHTRVNIPFITMCF